MSGRPSRVVARLVTAALLAVNAARAQTLVRPQPAAPIAGASRVDGQIMKPAKTALAPVANVWAVIHRVGSDAQGPIDSMRVGSDGRYHFTYTRSGSSDAVYFVSAMYAGIAYFSRPLGAQVVSGDDASIMVFDTTSLVFPLSVKGRHLIVAAPNVQGSREIVEAYELQNETDRTLVAKDDAHPSWSAALPAGATNLQVGESDISPAAVTTANGRVVVTAPFAPGLKQLSYSYRMPQSAFPLKVPVERGATVLELLLEEPRAEATGTSIKLVAPATVQGRIFQRYLGADAPAGASIDITVPSIVAPVSVQTYRQIAVALFALMIAALLAWHARLGGLRRMRAPAPLPITPTESLAREIATLDAEFERASAVSDGARASYELRRRELKGELASALQVAD